MTFFLVLFPRRSARASSASFLSLTPLSHTSPWVLERGTHFASLCSRERRISGAHLVRSVQIGKSPQRAGSEIILAGGLHGGTCPHVSNLSPRRTLPVTSRVCLDPSSAHTALSRARSCSSRPEKNCTDSNQKQRCTRAHDRQCQASCRNVPGAHMFRGSERRGTSDGAYSPRLAQVLEPSVRVE